VLQELDHAVNVLTNDNLELACTVIEKTATDKAIREIDDRLMPAYQVPIPPSPCSSLATSVVIEILYPLLYPLSLVKKDTGSSEVGEGPISYSVAMHAAANGLC
jgi:hypothetical protein